ncbi:hypothetical protein BJ322DRAFT_1108826 [Thelephora terrestris]|uniref:Uncharacterized protein n=1 Tax=Thelephora terrestris TaxID=56493 RepID=A0A9P6HF03_9AGAM|nr:hypothetical protein BJ322DRAFT_1108826 [Thelephora terrestris]
MGRGDETAGTQPPRRSMRSRAAASKLASDSNQKPSHTPTPMGSRGASLGQSDEVGHSLEDETPRTLEDQLEDDEFMPSTQEVAATLLAMRSRRCEPEDRGQRDEPPVQRQPETGTKIRGRVSPLFSFPLGNKTRTETYLSEDITNGRGSREWVTLHDEKSYERMMKTAAERIRARARKEADIKDPDLAFGWCIELKLRNKVKRLREDGEGGRDDAIIITKERKEEKGKKRKKKSKEKASAKENRAKQKKAFRFHRNLIPCSFGYFWSQKKVKRSVLSTPSSGARTPSTSNGDSDESESGSDSGSDMQIVVKIQLENSCGQCTAPCVILTTSYHHRLSMEELTLWAKLINCKEWSNFKRPPKRVLEKIYEQYPDAPLPSELSGRRAVSSKNTKQSTPAFNSPHMPGPFAGWPFHPMPGPSSISPFMWPIPGASHAPFNPAQSPAFHFNTSNPPVDEDLPRSPDSDDQDLEYPTIATFFEELEETESNRHHFTNFTEAFYEKGYYRVDELANESLTVEHMVEIIEYLKDGTARLIKSKAETKVRQIKRKSKAKK